MTTVAYKAGVLAADTKLTCNSTWDGSKVKILRRGRAMAAACGSSTHGQTFRDWFRKGMPAYDMPDLGRMDDGDRWCSGYVFFGGDQIVCFNPLGANHFRAPFYALGSGGEIALGAMAAGASAEEAVRIAAIYDDGTGGDITVLRANP